MNVPQFISILLMLIGCYIVSHMIHEKLDQLKDRADKMLKMEEEKIQLLRSINEK